MTVTVRRRVDGYTDGSESRRTSALSLSSWTSSSPNATDRNVNAQLFRRRVALLVSSPTEKSNCPTRGQTVIT